MSSGSPDDTYFEPGHRRVNTRRAVGTSLPHDRNSLRRSRRPPGHAASGRTEFSEGTTSKLDRERSRQKVDMGRNIVSLDASSISGKSEHGLIGDGHRNL